MSREWRRRLVDTVSLAVVPQICFDNRKTTGLYMALAVSKEALAALVPIETYGSSTLASLELSRQNNNNQEAKTLRKVEPCGQKVPDGPVVEP